MLTLSLFCECTPVNFCSFFANIQFVFIITFTLMDGLLGQLLFSSAVVGVTKFTKCCLKLYSESMNIVYMQKIKFTTNILSVDA